MSDVIRTRIDLLRRRARGGELARTGGRLIATLVIGLLAWLSLDYWVVTTVFGLGGWDIAARLALTGTLLWVAGREAWGGIMAEIRRRRGDDDLAMRLEHAYPDLAGRLISTVQLTRALEAGATRRVGSPGLVAALAEETQARAQSLDQRTAWDLRPARRAAGLALVVLAIAVGLAAWRQDIAGAFLKRLLFLSAHYPTATRITAVHVPTLVGRGDPVTVEIEVDPKSRVPAVAEALLRSPDGGISSVKLERVAGAAKPTFRGTVKQAIDDIAFRPKAGDHRWEDWAEVRVVQRPAVKQLKLQLIYPDYLKMPAETTTVGDLQVPAGTRIEVTVELSQAVKEARLEVRTGMDPATVIPMAIAANRGFSTGTFTATSDGTWTIGLVSPEGLESVDPPRWTIIVQADRPPVVTATFPARDKDVTRFARWPIRFIARDDHGVTQVRLRWRVIPSGADPESITTEPGTLVVPGSASIGTAPIQGEIFFDLTGLNLTPGARVNWWLEALDARSPEPNLAESQHGTFNVLDPAEMKDMMERKKAELIQAIKGIYKSQTDIKAGTEGTMKALEKK